VLDAFFVASGDCQQQDEAEIMVYSEVIWK